MKRKQLSWGKVLIAATALLTISNFAFGQTTPGGTVIRNRASATYTDDNTNPTKYNATSNEVTTTVSYVAGLSITPDGSTPATPVAPGATASYTFTVNNLGNFTDNVEFLASGASIRLTGTATGTIAQAFVDANTNGTFDGGDIDILTNGAAVTTSIAQSGSATVIVRVTASGTATAGQTLIVTLGDAGGATPFDNQAANNSANEVHTKHPGTITAVNGEREAKGDITMTVGTTAAVTNGPSGQPDAVGPGASTNTDYTNLAVSPAATNTPVVFDNTLKNGGNASDTFTIGIPTGGAPAGSTIEISLNGGGSWTTVTAGGTTVTTAAVAAGGTLNYKVRVTLPSGATTLTGYDTVVQVTSVADNTKTNNTIDRIYTGYLRLTKSILSVTNATGIGAATDPVPGADIEYQILYENIANAPVGTGNVDLSALQVVITEDGDVSPNNWATTTDRVASSESDSRGGTINITNSTGGVANSKYTDTVGTLAGGQTGTFRFKRKIKQ